MKSLNGIFSALITAALLLTGCSKSDQPAQVDTAPVAKSFASADPTLKATADKAVSLVKDGNYAGALQELQKLGANAKLNEDQKKAITDVVAKVQKAIAATVEKAATNANKTLGDVQKALGK